MTLLHFLTLIDVVGFYLDQEFAINHCTTSTRYTSRITCLYALGIFLWSCILLFIKCSSVLDRVPTIHLQQLREASLPAHSFIILLLACDTSSTFPVVVAFPSLLFCLFLLVRVLCFGMFCLYNRLLDKSNYNMECKVTKVKSENNRFIIHNVI